MACALPLLLLLLVAVIISILMCSNILTRSSSVEDEGHGRVTRLWCDLFAEEDMHAHMVV